MPTLDLTLNELDLVRNIVAGVNRSIAITSDGMANHAAVMAKLNQAVIDASMSALPAGWEPTLDGVSTEMNVTTGGTSWSRTFNGPSDGDTRPVVTAPCGPAGEVTAETVQRLRAWDMEQKGFKPSDPPTA